MTDISSSLNSRNQFVYKRKLESQNPSMAGCGSGTSGVSNSSGVSGVSGSSGASGASGASGYYSVCTVEGLKINEVIDLFTQGNLTVGEMNKWLTAHQNGVSNISKSTNNGVIRYQFTYGGKNYVISCSEKAAESQTDNLTQKTYLKNALKDFDQDTINNYFVLTEKYGNFVEKYALKPDCGFNDIDELKKFLTEEKYSFLDEDTIYVINDLLKDSLPNLTANDIRDMANELEKAAKAKGTDPTEYVSTRIIDFLFFQAEYPEMSLESMNNKLAIDGVCSMMLNNIFSAYAEVYGESIKSLEDLIELQSFAVINCDYEPKLRSAYIETRELIYMQSAIDGELLYKDYYNLLKDDLLNIFPQDYLDTSNEDFTKDIEKLSLEQIEYFVNKALTLPGIYDNNYPNEFDNFIDEFKHAVNNSSFTGIDNPDRKVELRELYQNTTGVEFDADGIIDIFDKLEEENDTNIPIETGNFIERVQNGELTTGEALWQIAYLAVGSPDDEAILNFVKSTSGNENIRVENQSIIFEDGECEKSITNALSRSINNHIYKQKALVNPKIIKKINNRTNRNQNTTGAVSNPNTVNNYSILQKLYKTVTYINKYEEYERLGRDAKIENCRYIYELKINKNSQSYKNFINSGVEEANKYSNPVDKVDAIVNYLKKYLNSPGHINKFAESGFNDMPIEKAITEYGKYTECRHRAAALYAICKKAGIDISLDNGIYFVQGHMSKRSPTEQAYFDRKLGRKFNPNNFNDWIEVGPNHAWCTVYTNDGCYIYDIVNSFKKIDANNPVFERYNTCSGKQVYKAKTIYYHGSLDDNINKLRLTMLELLAANNDEPGYSDTEHSIQQITTNTNEIDDNQSQEQQIYPQGGENTPLAPKPNITPTPNPNPAPTPAPYTPDEDYNEDSQSPSGSDNNNDADVPTGKIPSANPLDGQDDEFSAPATGNPTNVNVQTNSQGGENGTADFSNLYSDNNRVIGGNYSESGINSNYDKITQEANKKINNWMQNKLNELHQKYGNNYNYSISNNNGVVTWSVTPKQEPNKSNNISNDTKSDKKDSVGPFTDIDEKNLTSFLAGDGVKILYFGSASAGPCKMYSPTLQAVSDQLQNAPVSFGQVDVSANEDIAEKYGVLGVPTILIFKNGKVENSITGIQTKYDLLETIEQYY